MFIFCFVSSLHGEKKKKEITSLEKVTSSSPPPSHHDCNSLIFSFDAFFDRIHNKCPHCLEYHLPRTSTGASGPHGRLAGYRLSLSLSRSRKNKKTNEKPLFLLSTSACPSFSSSKRSLSLVCLYHKSPHLLSQCPSSSPKRKK